MTPSNQKLKIESHPEKSANLDYYPGTPEFVPNSPCKDELNDALLEKKITQKRKNSHAITSRNNSNLQ